MMRPGLCTSDAAESPRGINFLFDANRLNVAVSRARTLVVVVGNPALATTRVASVEQMKKVNVVAGLMGGSLPLAFATDGLDGPVKIESVMP